MKFRGGESELRLILIKKTFTQWQILGVKLWCFFFWKKASSTQIFRGGGRPPSSTVFGHYVEKEEEIKMNK